MLKISVSGIRGIWSKDISPDSIIPLLKSFYHFLENSLQKSHLYIAIGRDGRKSSEPIYNIVRGILQSLGAKNVLLDLIPTPILGFMVREEKLDGGIMITASHNPPEWNALKFFKNNGKFLNHTDLEELKNILKTIQQVSSYVETDEIIEETVIPLEEVEKKYFNKISSIIDIEAIRGYKFRVGFDPVNSVGVYFGKDFLEFLGCVVKSIHTDTRKFPEREIEPVPDNLESLSKLVKSNFLDIGFALDADGDRLSIVDDKGIPIGEEYTLALTVDYVLEKFSENDKKKVVINVSTSKLVEFVARKHNAELVYAKVGEANVLEKMEEVGAIVGGEGNGGVIFPLINPSRDAFVAIALILSLLKEKNTKLSDYIQTLPSYHIIKEKLTWDGKIENLYYTTENVINILFPGREKILTDIDGLRIDLPEEEMWVHVRQSNTEPIVRIIAEGKDKEKIKKIVDTLKIEISYI